MEDLILKVAPQAPGLVIAFLIVKYFLVALRDQAERTETLVRDLSHSNKEVARRYEGATTKATQAIAENTEVLRGVKKRIGVTTDGKHAA